VLGREMSVALAMDLSICRFSEFFFLDTWLVLSVTSDPPTVIAPVLYRRLGLLLPPTTDFLP